MNQKNTTLNENRYLSNHERKFKRIKNGVIFIIIFAIVIIASNAVMEIQYNWTEVVIQENYIKYRNGEIIYDTYRSILENLEYDRIYFRWIISIVSNSAEVCMNIGFLILIIGFLYITIDKSFNKKMRRMSLILAGSILIFMMYLNFEYLHILYVTYYYPPIF